MRVKSSDDLSFLYSPRKESSKQSNYRLKRDEQVYTKTSRSNNSLLSLRSERQSSRNSSGSANATWCSNIRRSPQGGKVSQSELTRGVRTRRISSRPPPRSTPKLEEELNRGSSSPADMNSDISSNGALIQSDEFLLVEMAGLRVEAQPKEKTEESLQSKTSDLRYNKRLLHTLEDNRSPILALATDTFRKPEHGDLPVEQSSLPPIALNSSSSYPGLKKSCSASELGRLSSRRRGRRDEFCSSEHSNSRLTSDDKLYMKTSRSNNSVSSLRSERQSSRNSSGSANATWCSSPRGGEVSQSELTRGVRTRRANSRPPPRSTPKLEEELNQRSSSPADMNSDTSSNGALTQSDDFLLIEMMVAGLRAEAQAQEKQEEDLQKKITELRQNQLLLHALRDSMSPILALATDTFRKSEDSDLLRDQRSIPPIPLNSSSSHRDLTKSSSASDLGGLSSRRRSNGLCRSEHDNSSLSRDGQLCTKTSRSTNSLLSLRSERQSSRNSSGSANATWGSNIRRSPRAGEISQSEHTKGVRTRRVYSGPPPRSTPKLKEELNRRSSSPADMSSDISSNGARTQSDEFLLVQMAGLRAEAQAQEKTEEDLLNEITELRQKLAERRNFIVGPEKALKGSINQVKKISDVSINQMKKISGGGINQVKKVSKIFGLRQKKKEKEESFAADSEVEGVNAVYSVGRS